MCSGHGWDIASDGERIWIEPHFCRIWGDCGHSDNTLESIPPKIVEMYQAQLDYNREHGYDYEPGREAFVLDEIEKWGNLSHSSYTFYTEQEYEGK